MTTIEIENAASPGHMRPVNAAKYHAMRAAYLDAVPSGPPGLTPSDVLKRLLPNLSPVEFPGGDKAGWWAKAVQLDLEAKRLIKRGATGPVRLWRV